MSFNWDDDTALRLIDKFHDNELLWNPGHPDYKNRNKRTEGLRILASLFGADSNEIERKIKNLTSHYYREKKKLDETRKAGLEDVREPKWFAYEALDFLRVKYSDNNSVTESQQQPRTPVTSRKRRLNPDSGISEALKVLKDASSIRDEAAIFGEYIATKIRRMDSITTSTVQHLIQNIIYQGEMGIYSRTPLASPGYFTGPSPGQSNLSSNDANSEPQDSLYTLDTDFKSVFKAE